MSAYLIKTDVLEEFSNLNIGFEELKAKRKELKTQLNKLVKSVPDPNQDAFGIDLIFEGSESEIQKIETQVKKIENNLKAILNESEVEIKDVSSSKLERSMKNSVEVIYHFKNSATQDFDKTKELEEKNLIKTELETENALLKAKIKYFQTLISKMKFSFQAAFNFLPVLEETISTLAKFDQTKKENLNELIGYIRNLLTPQSE